MSWEVAAAATFLQLAGSYHGGQAAKEGNYLEGKELERTARETLLTAKWNIGNIKDQGFLQSINLQEQAGDRRALISMAGKSKLGKIETAIGASGVQMTSGTSADQLIQARLNNALQLLDNQEELDTSLANLKLQTEGHMEQTWYNAKTKASKMERMAEIARKGGDTAQFAALMGGITQGMQTFHSMGGSELYTS